MSATPAPRVSVIVPCYNLGVFLDEAVSSVLAQTFQDFEILVVDDGSTDAETRALVDRYERPRTRVIRIEHAGLAAARNAGVAAARGEYLCALDADDRLAPAFLEKTVRTLDGDPSIAFASTWLRTFGTEEWEWKPERCDLPTLLSENTVLTASLVRRSAVADVGGYDTAMPVQGDEDWDLWLRLVERGHRGTILREVLFEYRRRPGSMSTICWHGPGHLPLAKYRIAMHEDAYRAHLSGVLRRQDDESAALLRHNDELERLIGSDLEPAVAARREELRQLRERLVLRHARDERVDEPDRPGIAAAARIHELESTLHIVAEEAAALRNSMSWRLTAPLRDAYGWWRRQRGRA